ncbi:MAG: TonB-dependent siderophore receptor [Nostoc sp.]|uniref:TonB-dependent siderophore receptor n=1 Tax=Nostoc sp. TaxID=1180 RepID=UPI002FF94955
MRLAWTSPLTSDGKLAYRLNASYLTSNSFIDSYYRKRPFVSGVIDWQLDRNTKLTLEAEYLEANQTFDYGIPAVGTVLPNPNGKIPLSRFVGEPDNEVQNRRTTRLGYNFEHKFSDNWSVNNTFRLRMLRYEQNIDFPQALAADNRTLRRFRQDFLDTVVWNNYIMDTNIIGKFKIGSIKHQIVAGFDFYRDIVPNFNNTFRTINSLDLFNPVYGQLQIGSVFRTTNQKTRDSALGIYLQDQVTFTDNLKLLLGGRFDSVENQVTNRITSQVTTQPDSAFSPRLGIVYQPIAPVSLYASYSRSFEQVTGQIPLDGGLFRPQRGTQYEVGIKADLLANKLSTTLVFYQLTLSNVLTPDPRNSLYNVQTGEQISRGIELNVVGEISPGWSAIASYNYIDARVTEDNRYKVGNQLINVPENAFSLWTTYIIPQGSLKGLGFGLGLFYVGERQGDLDNSFQLPSYFRTDAAIYYRKNNLNLALNLKNLFDVDYFETSRSRLQVYPGDPFTAELTLGWQF